MTPAGRICKVSQYVSVQIDSIAKPQKQKLSDSRSFFKFIHLASTVNTASVQDACDGSISLGPRWDDRNPLNNVHTEWGVVPFLSLTSFFSHSG